MEKIVIIGSNGQLGHDLCEAFQSYEVFPLTHANIDIRFDDLFDDVLAGVKADVVVNTAAYHHLDNCEIHPDHSFQVNALGVACLARACKKHRAKFVHVSTDYVFDGYKELPYTELDSPCPLNVYGNTKLSGEYFVRSIMDKYYIVRTSALYGKAICRSKNAPNFVQRMIDLSEKLDSLKVVDSEIVSPTSTKDLAAQIKIIVESGEAGLYHATSEGYCSWYEFTKYFFDLLNIKTPVIKAQPGDFPQKTKRPSYSVLENDHLKTLGLNRMLHWKDAVQDYLNSSDAG